jgi:hypothetical protein
MTSPRPHNSPPVPITNHAIRSRPLSVKAAPITATPAPTGTITYTNELKSNAASSDNSPDARSAADTNVTAMKPHSTRSRLLPNIAAKVFGESVSVWSTGTPGLNALVTKPVGTGQSNFRTALVTAQRPARTPTSSDRAPQTAHRTRA